MAKEVINKVLDLSVHQGILSDDAVAKIKASGVWVILRIGYTGYGSLAPAPDTVFEQNYKKLYDAGVKLGAYYFTIAYNKVMADKEIAFILKTLDGKRFELPFYLDVEGQTNSAAWTNLSGDTRADLSAYICTAVQTAGYYVGIYSSKHGFTSKWLNMNKLTAFDKWVAQYNITCNYTGQYGMWQYSSKESASKYGITKGSYVDISNAYYDFPAIIKSKGLNHINDSETIENKKYVTCTNCGARIEVI